MKSSRKIQVFTFHFIQNALFSLEFAPTPGKLNGIPPWPRRSSCAVLTRGLYSQFMKTFLQPLLLLWPSLFLTPHSLSYEPLLPFPRWKITGQPLPLCSPHLEHWPLPKLCHPIWDHLTPLWSVSRPGSIPPAYLVHSCSIQVPLTSSCSCVFLSLRLIQHPPPPFIHSTRKFEYHYVLGNALCQSKSKLSTYPQEA